MSGHIIFLNTNFQNVYVFVTKTTYYSKINSAKNSHFSILLSSWLSEEHLENPPIF